MKENKKAQSKIVQTYAEDMAKVLENDKSGLVKKIIHDEEQHEEEKKNLSPESKKNEFFMLFGLLLILAAFTTLFFFFSKRDVASVPAQEQFRSIIFTDQSTLLEVADLKKAGIEKKVLAEVTETTVKVGGIEGIYLTLNKSPVGLRKFIEIINGDFVPGDRNFVNDNFLMGVVNSKIKFTATEAEQNKPVSALRDEPVSPTSKNFFILLKVRSMADIFEAIHAWENKMFSDLHGFFGVPLSPETKYLLTKNFEDGIVENKNARILYKNDEPEENEIILMYVLADDNSVIITNSENAVREIILRLAASEVKK